MSLTSVMTKKKVKSSDFTSAGKTMYGYLHIIYQIITTFLEYVAFYT